MSEADILRKYFPALSDQQIDQYLELQNLYLHWNQKINVISRKDTDQIFTHHILHSLAIAKICHFQAKTKILDLGTGGGLPGIPLAIFFQDVQFHLVDSIGKKIKVVKEICKALNLSNVSAEQSRAESVHSKFDFITGRAIANFPKLLGLSKDKIHKNANNELTNGLLYLKGGDFAEDLQQLTLQYRVYELSRYFQEEYFTTKKLVHIKI